MEQLLWGSGFYFVAWELGFFVLRSKRGCWLPWLSFYVITEPESSTLRADESTINESTIMMDESRYNDPDVDVNGNVTETSSSSSRDERMRVVIYPIQDIGFHRTPQVLLYRET